MRNLVLLAALALMLGIVSCKSDKPGTNKATDDELKQIIQCTVYGHFSKQAVLKGKDLEEALKVLRHCLSIQGRKSIEDLLGEGDKHAPEYMFYFEVTDSREPRSPLYGINWYQNLRILDIVPGSAFMPDKATQDMVENLIEKCERNADKDIEP